MASSLFLQLNGGYSTPGPLGIGTTSLTAGAALDLVGAAYLSDGTAAAPSLARRTTPGSGLWFDTANVAVSVSGTQRYTLAAGTLTIWNTASAVSLNGDAVLKRIAAGTVQLGNADTATGFTSLRLGPLTGNTTSGSTEVRHVTTTIDMATASGTGTGTITVANFFPANCTLLSMSGRVTTVLAGAALGTWSIGPSGATWTDLDAFGAGLAKDADTLVRPDTYTVTSLGQVIPAAHNLVITASAGVFSTGVLKVTATVLVPTPIGS